MSWKSGHGLVGSVVSGSLNIRGVGKGCGLIWRLILADWDRIWFLPAVVWRISSVPSHVDLSSFPHQRKYTRRARENSCKAKVTAFCDLITMTSHYFCHILFLFYFLFLPYSVHKKQVTRASPYSRVRDYTGAWKPGWGIMRNYIESYLYSIIVKW